MDKDLSRVVIAIDGSDVSFFALKQYSELMMEPRDHVVCLLVGERTDITYNAIGPLDKSLVRALVEAEEGKISERIEKVKKNMEELKLNGDILRAYGDPGPAILKKAKELDAKYIVTGSRGLGTIRKTLLGSVSSYLLHHSHIPIVVCKMTK